MITSKLFALSVAALMGLGSQFCVNFGACLPGASEIVQQTR
jgi:hypothetical protein